MLSRDTRPVKINEIVVPRSVAHQRIIYIWVNLSIILWADPFWIQDQQSLTHIFDVNPMIFFEGNPMKIYHTKGRKLQSWGPKARYKYFIFLGQTNIKLGILPKLQTAYQYGQKPPRKYIATEINYIDLLKEMAMQFDENWYRKLSMGESILVLLWID